jgi:hypothetical protein
LYFAIGREAEEFSGVFNLYCMAFKSHLWANAFLKTVEG